MSKVTPFLWFETQAEEAANFYAEVFKDAKKGKVNRMSEDVPGPAGKVLTVEIELGGLQFTFLNGGPAEGFKFSPATSFVISCEDQSEVDYYWEKLGDGGRYNQCGWLDDKFGVTWQVVPKGLSACINGPDAEGSRRATQAMLKMQKLDIKALEDAYNGK